jgi:hypothetical protein
VAERLARDGFAVVVNDSGDPAPAEAPTHTIHAARGQPLAAKAAGPTETDLFVRGKSPR